jgi:signal transduction histidine kinase
MPLAKLQWLFFAFALALLTALTAVLVRSHLAVGRSLADLGHAQQLVRTVARMRTLTDEASTNRAVRHELQWGAGMVEFAQTIQPMQTGFAEEILLLEIIQVDVKDADQVFRRLMAITPVQRMDAAADPMGNRARMRRALHVLLEDVTIKALQLSELQTTEIRAARLMVIWSSGILAVAMLAIVVAYFIIFRRFVLAPITQLQAATDRVAAGDLVHRVGMKSNDEFGELGRRFDHMTEQLQASQKGMNAAIKELDSFAYSVSHDLRAPLRGMDAFSQILQKKYAAQMDEDAQHCLHMIRDNAQQMGRLIDDLLAFSRLSQQPLRKEQVDQQALVRTVLQAFQMEQRDRRFDLEVGELPAVEADPRLLKQVWVNLISNALKYTRARDKAMIRVGSEKNNGTPVYFVQDNGVGFDMRYAHKLFGVFQRLHRAEDYEGTGVGLAIVQRIIARHGGQIWAKAAKNQGAAFYFTLEGEQGDA